VGGVVLNITYGHKVESIEDPLVINCDKAMINTVNVPGPGSVMVDFIPICAFVRLAFITELGLTARRAQ